MTKGMFIVFEGIDGSGKTSVCRAVAERIGRTRKVVLTAEPTTDEIGMLIRSGSVKDASQEVEALLFVADRAHHTLRIREWVDSGHIVICDRYYASTLAYQAAPLDGRSLDMEWLMTLNRPVILRPDITFLMDIMPRTGLERIGGRGTLSKFEREDYLDAVRNNYLEIAERDGFTVIDAERPLDGIVDEVTAAIGRRME